MKGKVTKWDRWGYELAWERETCVCRRYDGPEPLGGFYAPEITDGRSRRARRCAYATVCLCDEDPLDELDELLGGEFLTGLR